MELHVSTLLDALDPSLQAPFVRTSVWIADDRDLAGEWLHVAEAPIAVGPMAGWEGSFWTTEEFVIADFGGDPRWHGAWIEITGDGAEVWYNPIGWFKRSPKLLKALEYLPEVSLAIADIFAELEADTNNTWRQQYTADDDGEDPRSAGLDCRCMDRRQRWADSPNWWAKAARNQHTERPASRRDQVQTWDGRECGSDDRSCECRKRR
jgi:hypothetical protein